MSSVSCADISADLPALALGALDTEESARIAAHLRECPACRAEFEQLAAVSRGLLYAVPPRIPPHSIKTALMARVQHPETSWLERLGTWLRVPQLAPRWAFALVLAAIIAIGGAFGVQVTRLAQQQDLLAGQVRQQQAALALLASATVDSISMQATLSAAGASASMHYDEDSTVAVLQTTKLPVLSPTQTYQLWLIGPDGRRDSAAVFDIAADSGGSITLVVMAPKPMKAYTRCGVSIEPRGGSPQPTSPDILASSLWS
jgi:anti-sigma-K factor RskA